MRVLLSLIFAVVFTVAYSEKFSYTGYREIRVFPQTVKHLVQLVELENIDTELDFWTDVRGINDPVVILLSPKKFAEFSAFANSNNIPFTVVVENFQDIIDEEARSMRDNPKRQDIGIINKYARYNDIQNFIDDACQNNPTICSGTYIPGRSVEGRNLKVIKLGNGAKQAWIDCGIHAREWVTPASCVFMIYNLIEDYKKSDPLVLELLNHYTLHILPIHNPDGYEFTHTSTRMWRKNRRINSGSTCMGTDLNRNYPYKWLIANGGASNNPCSDTFAGPSAASEPETQAVINALSQNTFDFFLTIHSYGLWWLNQWGDQYTLPLDYNETARVGQIGANAARNATNVVFTVGSSANLLYLTCGTSADYAYATLGIKYSHTIECRPGQTGPDSQYGFALPENLMPLVSAEVYAGVKAFAKEVKNVNLGK